MNRLLYIISRNWVLACTIAIITFIVYIPVLKSDFVIVDDPVHVYLNPYIQGGVKVEAVRWAFTSEYDSKWIPLTWISYMIDIQFFGRNAGMHHLVNLLWHVASSILLFLALRRATGASLRSAAVSFLFALHPLHVESVAWVAERKDVLSTFFWMLTIYLYIWYAEEKRVWRYIAVLLSYAFGLLSKPMVVTLPVILLLMDWWPLRRVSFGSFDRAEISRLYRLILEKLPLFALSLATSVITYMVQKAGGEVVIGLSISDRIGRACIAYIQYVYKMIWPVNLAVLYPFEEQSPSAWAVVFSVLSLVAVTYLVFRQWKRMPYLITGWLWYIIALLPVIGLVQIGHHSITDRYTYIPLNGLFLVLAWGLPEILRYHPSRQGILAIISALILFIMITLTSMQVRLWKNSETLLTHTIEVTERNWWALNSLGLDYYQKGRVDESIWLFEESLRYKPSDVLTLLNLGSAYYMKKDMREAIRTFEKVLLIEPGNLKAHIALGLLYFDTGSIYQAKEEYALLRSAGSPFADELLRLIRTKDPLFPG